MSLRIHQRHVVQFWVSWKSPCRCGTLALLVSMSLFDFQVDKWLLPCPILVTRPVGGLVTTLPQLNNIPIQREQQFAQPPDYRISGRHHGGHQALCCSYLTSTLSNRPHFTTRGARVAESGRKRPLKIVFFEDRETDLLVRPTAHYQTGADRARNRRSACGSSFPSVVNNEVSNQS